VTESLHFTHFFFRNSTMHRCDCMFGSLTHSISVSSDPPSPVGADTGRSSRELERFRIRILILPVVPFTLLVGYRELLWRSSLRTTGEDCHSVGCLAAVDWYSVSGDVRDVGRTEKRHHTCHLLWFGETNQFDDRLDSVSYRGRRTPRFTKQARLDIRLRWTRGNRVHSDTPTGVLECR
jgi:hypothetical protein